MVGDKIYSYDDLVKISNLLTENNLSYDNLTIDIGIKTQKMLDRINYDLFHNLNPKSNETVKSVDEIIISINGVKFRYFLDKNNDNI